MEHRTQIYLTQADYRRAVRYAHQRSLSLASVVREALGEYLTAREGEAPPASGQDAIDDLLGLCSPLRVRGDMAARHDEALVTALGGRRRQKKRPGTR